MKRLDEALRFYNRLLDDPSIARTFDEFQADPNMPPPLILKDVPEDQAQRLIQAGITQAGGQRLFSRASEYIQRLNRLRVAQGRTNEIELQDIIQSEVQQDPQAQLEQQRILNQQASMSSLQTGAVQTQGGAVAGLEEV